LGKVSAVAISPVDPKIVGGVMMFRYKKNDMMNYHEILHR
jgi:hypothetical protein